MTTAVKLGTQAIGAAGKLLVQLLDFYTGESVGPKSLSDMTAHRLEAVISALLDGRPRELP